MTSTHPVVSILTPAYNSAAFIAETIESVLQQTWSDFELLIVDDGSSDGTLDVVRAFARRDARVKSFSSPHGGARCQKCRGATRRRPVPRVARQRRRLGASVLVVAAVAAPPASGNLNRQRECRQPWRPARRHAVLADHIWHARAEHARAHRA